MINPKTIRINNILTEINGEIIHCIPSDIGHHLIVYCSIFTFQFILRLRICNDCCWEFNSSSISHSKCKVRFIWLWFAWNIFFYILLRSLDDHLNIIALDWPVRGSHFFHFQLHIWVIRGIYMEHNQLKDLYGSLWIRIMHSRLHIKMLAYEGAILMPITVPLMCM